MSSVEEMYGSFGTHVVEMVRSEILANSDLSRILGKLNVPSSPTLRAQHEALRAFLFRFGVGFFLTIMKSNWCADEVENQKAQKIAAAGRAAGVGGGKAVPAAHPTPSHVHHEPPERPSPAEHHDAGNGIPSVAQVQQVPVVWIDTPEYRGAERRSGVERRVGPPDRRAQLEAINKNRRFGGRDRRKTIRRAADRERLQKKP